MGVEISYSLPQQIYPKSCPARGMGVEIKMGIKIPPAISVKLVRAVMPREGHGSRNHLSRKVPGHRSGVMPREGHGSRNLLAIYLIIRGGQSCPARGMGVEINIILNFQ